MLKTTLAAALLVVSTCTSFAGPKEDATAVANKFISAFVAGDLNATLAVYSPDALFWGTVMPEIGTKQEDVRKYFADNYAARATVPLTGASITDSHATVLSKDVVLLAGRWQTERPNAVSLLRFTMIVQKKGKNWQIVHLHSSPRPAPR